MLPDLTCPSEPRLADVRTDAEFGAWVLEVRSAYQACAAQLGAVREEAAKWPK